ncbi:MAG TPA: DinB family protein [Streptosporangiaceae bacterium]
MNWIAPQVARTDPPVVGDERTLLDGWLDFHRQTLLMKCAGLTAEQLTLRTAPPSGLSLIGLLRHLTEVERVWFRRRLAGERIDFHYRGQDGDLRREFDDIDPARAEREYAAYVREVESARAAAAGRSLDDTFYNDREQREQSLRWMYLHVITEYARHDGHADLLRERIDGATGR